MEIIKDLPKVGVVYCRVSTKDQTSTKEQGEAIVAYCNSNNIKVLEVVEEKRSADSDENETDVYAYLKRRPELDRIVKQGKAGLFNVLLVWKWDRLARDELFQESIYRILRGHGVSLYALRDSNEVLSRKVMGIVDSEENRKKKERIALKFKGKFDEGLYVGRTPFGYKKSKKEGNIVPHPTDSDRLVEIFTKTISGVSYKDICPSITIYKKKQKKYINLPLKSYYNILRNRVYCGYVSHNGMEKKGIHTQLIDESMFTLAQQKIKKQSPKKRKGVKNVG